MLYPLWFFCRIAWQLACLAEVLVSTFIHVTYAACIVSYALVLENMREFQNDKKNSDSTKKKSSNVMKMESIIATAPPSSFSADVPPAAGEKNSPNGKNFHLAPIILLHGIFGFGHGKLGGMSYFGGVEFKDERVFVPDLGSISSIHDRACELFYYLKGGVVDYGEDHSRKFGHNRFGKMYTTGHFPEWNEDHPVHLMGHSSGVQVARLLQTMLAEKRFPGYEFSSEGWVASITSLSGAMNGTTRVYLDGISPSDGFSMQPLSLIQWLRFGVILIEWLDIPHLKKFYSWGFDHFDLSWRKIGLRGLFSCLFGKSGPFRSGDWIMPDLSIQSGVALNRRLKTYPTTYYFSYATIKTRRLWGKTLPSSSGIHPLFVLRALQMSLWKHPKNLPLPYPGYRDEDWQDNDGALNTISMLFPRIPEQHPHTPLKLNPGELQRYRPGIWYYTILDADHITFILDSSRAGIHFEILYDSIFERCRKQLTLRGPESAIADYCCEYCVLVCICSTKNSSFLGA